METTEEVKKNVNDVLENAQNYATQLQDLLANLKDAQTQIQATTHQTRNGVEETFACLKAVIAAAIDHRKGELIAQVCSIEEEELLPMQQCYDVINEKLNLTLELVDEGHQILHKQTMTEETVARFNEKSASLGSLPEVPHPSQLSCITFNFDPMLPSQLATLLSSHGTVSQTSPVQITKSSDRPGALLLHWEEIETEKEASEFRLQHCQGDARGTDHIFLKFQDVYSGPEKSFLVKNLASNVFHSFRVCSRVDRSNCWSAWSIPHVATTLLSSCGWKENNENYLISEDATMATKLTTALSILYSHELQLTGGHSVTFTIVDRLTCKDDEGVGLSRVQMFDATTLLLPGFIFVNMNGAVYVDGKEMTTRLPSLDKGSKVDFELEAFLNRKLRISIGCEGKSVSYDWKMDREKEEMLTFVAFFRRVGWKVSIN